MPVFNYIELPSGDIAEIISPNAAIAESDVGTPGVDFDAAYGFVEIAEDDAATILSTATPATGVYSGLVPTQDSATEILVAEGTGNILDFSDPAAPLEINVVWSDAVTPITVTTLGTDGQSAITLSRDQVVEFTLLQNVSDEFYRDNIRIGFINHEAGAIVEVFFIPQFPREPYQQMVDFWEALGVFNMGGFSITPTVTGFSTAAGELMNPGAGADSGGRRENVIPIPAQSPLTTFQEFLGITNTITESSTQVMNVTQYDDGSGSLVNIPGGNSAVIKYLFLFPTTSAPTNISIMHGQTVYSNLQDAIDNSETDFTDVQGSIPEPYASGSVLLARWAIEDGGDLSNSAEAHLLPGSIFGTRIGAGGGASGGGGGDVFGPASSTQNEISTYSDATGKNLSDDSDISALTGSLQRLTLNADLTLAVNGTGLINVENSSFGAGDSFVYPTVDTVEGDVLVTDGAGNLTFDTSFKSSLIAPLFSDARFFSELGLADTQGWAITTSGTASVTLVSESVFGVPQDVHKLNDNTSGGIASVTLLLDANDWSNIFDFGASYSGIVRLDTNDGFNGAFLGLGCLAVDSPDASPDKRRFGLNVTKSLTTNELNIAGTDGNALDVDVAGTTFDSYNDVTIKITLGIPPTAEVFVNGDLEGTLDFLVHTGGTQTDCSWSSGSTGGVDRITYMSNYGVTIYESDSTILVGDADLNVDVAKTIIPPGRRDYIFNIAEAVTGSKIGNIFQVVAQNNGGLVTVQNENPSNPKALFNGLNTLTVPVAGVLEVNGVNTVEGGNNYVFNLPPARVSGAGIVTLYQDSFDLRIGSQVDDGTGSKLQITGGISNDGDVIDDTNNITIFYEGVITSAFSLLLTRNGVSFRYFGPDKEIVSINAALGTPDSGAFKGSMFVRVDGSQMSTNTGMSGSANTVVNIPVNSPPFFLVDGDTIDIDYSDGDNIDALNLMVYLELR